MPESTGVTCLAVDECCLLHVQDGCQYSGKSKKINYDDSDAN